MKLIRFIGIVAPMLVAGVCLVSNPLSARPTDPAAVIDIPKLDGIVINGNSDDWSDRGYRVEVVTTDSGDVLPPEDLAVSPRMERQRSARAVRSSR